MAIYIGTTKLQSSSNLHVSTTEIKNIHIDNNLVWQSYVPPVVLFGTNQGSMDDQYSQGLFDLNLAGAILFVVYSKISVTIMQPSMYGYYGYAEIDVYNYNTVYSGSDGSSVKLISTGGNTMFDVSMAVDGFAGEPR